MDTLSCPHLDLSLIREHGYYQFHPHNLALPPDSWLWEADSGGMDTNCLNLKARFAGKILEAAVQLPASVAMVASASFHLLNLSGVLLLVGSRKKPHWQKGLGTVVSGLLPPCHMRKLRPGELVTIFCSKNPAKCMLTGSWGESEVVTEGRRTIPVNKLFGSIERR